MGVDLAPKPEVDENNPYYETPVFGEISRTIRLLSNQENSFTENKINQEAEIARLPEATLFNFKGVSSKISISSLVRA